MQLPADSLGTHTNPGCPCGFLLTELQSERFDIFEMPAHSWLQQSPAKAPLTAELAGLLCCPGCHSNCRQRTELQEEFSSRDGKIRHSNELICRELHGVHMSHLGVDVNVWPRR